MSNNYETGWLKVGTAGATVDGRIIKESWLSEMARLYDPKNEYTAQVWAWSHWNHYETYGKVTAVKKGKDEKGRLSLYVKISPLPRLVELNRAGQLKHSSMEIQPNYKSEGKAYLTGLLLTNDPASIATDEINLSKNNNDKDDKPLISEAITFKADFELVDKEPHWFKKSLDRYFGEKLNNNNDDDELMNDADFERIETLFENKLDEKLEAFKSEFKPESDSDDEEKITALEADKTALEQQITVLEADKIALENKVNELSVADPDVNTSDPENLGPSGAEEGFS